jgi:hypothetical protein
MDEVRIIEMYTQGKGSPTIAKEFGTNFYEILKVLKRNKIELRSARKSSKRTIFDEKFFERIDTEEKAYFLGFILADGCISVKRNYLKIGISSKDIIILKEFNRIMKSDVKIHTYPHKGSFSGERYELSSLTFISPKIVSDLNNLGIGERKTFTVIPPIIDESLEHHFWRGVMDGDGHISLYNTKNLKHVPNIEFGICGNMSTMSSLSTFLTKYGIDHKITPDKSIFRIRLTNRRALKILDILYKNSTIFLDRKKANYMMYKNARQEADKSSPKNLGIKKTKSGNYTSSSLISIHGIQKRIGTFKTFEEALEAQNNFSV